MNFHEFFLTASINEKSWGYPNKRKGLSRNKKNKIGNRTLCNPKCQKNVEIAVEFQHKNTVTGRFCIQYIYHSCVRVTKKISQILQKVKK